MRYLFYLLLTSIVFSQPSVITEETIAHLPVSLQTFLKLTNTVGNPLVRKISLTQSGEMKMTPDGDWINFKAKQTFNLEDIAFKWKGVIKAAPFVKVSAVDRYENGHGSLKIKLWSIIPLGTEDGDGISQAELMRYLSELIWCPSGLTDPRITWVSLNDSMAIATLRDNGIEASGTFTFPQNGLARFRAPRMAEITKGIKKLEDWETVTTVMRQVNGYMIPAEGVALYHLSDGKYEYIRVQIDQIEYTY